MKLCISHAEQFHPMSRNIKHLKPFALLGNKRQSSHLLTKFLYSHHLLLSGFSKNVATVLAHRLHQDIENIVVSPVRSRYCLTFSSLPQPLQDCIPGTSEC